MKFFLVLICCCSVLILNAQRNKKKNYKQVTQNCFTYVNNSKLKNTDLTFSDSTFLMLQEDSLIYYINLLQTDLNVELKKHYDSCFLITLKKTLQYDKSFYYPFEKLYEYIYIVQNKKQTFKIFTWQYSVNTLSTLQQGVIQIKYTPDSIVTIPLFDRSNQILKIYDSILSPNRWVGALYYDIIETNDHTNKPVYTLLGLDENTILSTKKWIEIFTFDNACKPIFGGDYFNFKPNFNFANPEKKLNKKNYNEKNIPYKRYNIEYSKQNNANLKFDEELNIIIFDHLVPSDDNTKERKYSYQIDGDYEGFKWVGGKWEYIPQVFDYDLKDGEAPNEVPLNFNKRKIK